MSGGGRPSADATAPSDAAASQVRRRRLGGLAMTKRILVAVAIAVTVTSALCFGSSACAQQPVDCGGADTVVVRKIRGLLERDDMRSHTLATYWVRSLERARALCAGPQAQTALRLYAELLLDMEMYDRPEVASSGPPSLDLRGAEDGSSLAWPLIPAR